LYFRLSVFPITIPPLRERPEDIEILARHFIERGCRELGKNLLTLAPSALEALKRYRWPGNVRELQNCIERAVILADGETIHAKHLSLTSELAVLTPPESPLVNFDFSGTLAEVTNRATEAVERVAIGKALEQANGDVARAADRLQVNFKALSVKIRQYGL
jgi:DNA-binding NtrC family response regulator